MANELRTRSVITSRQKSAGYSWLGPTASLEEYEVGAWLESHNVPYIYQAEYGSFRSKTKVDFQLLNTAPPIVLFVQGDKWHMGEPQRVYDREQAILVADQGAVVIEIFGHDIVAYPGYPVPTDAHFDRVMSAAVRGVQIGSWSG